MNRPSDWTAGEYAAWMAGGAAPTPYADEAEHVWSSCLGQPLPVPYAQKEAPPDGYTGHDGREAPWWNIITGWMVANAGDNICVRLARNVIGIDVDGYGVKIGAKTLAELEAKLGPLPPTLMVTSREGGVSGIRLFIIPEGLEWPGKAGTDVDVIHFGYRYVMWRGSRHPEGRDYFTLDQRTGEIDGDVDGAAEQLPALPDAWVEYLTGMATARKMPTVWTGPKYADLSATEQAKIDGWLEQAVTWKLDELRACHAWPEGYAGKWGRGYDKIHADVAQSFRTVDGEGWADPAKTKLLLQRYLEAAAPPSGGWTKRHPLAKWKSQDKPAAAGRIKPPDWLVKKTDTPPVQPNLTGDTVPIPAKASGGEGGKKSAATQLVELAIEGWRFGISTEGDPFALPLHGPKTVSMLRGSASLRAKLADLYHQRTGTVAGQQALSDALLALEGKARSTDPVPLALRVAYVDGAVWLDLGDLTGRAIRVTSDGWSVVAEPPILFRRTALTGALPEPVRDGSPDDLWRLLNVAPESRPVLLAWLVAGLLPDIPHPICALTGEQGTGKSTASKMLSALIDPSPAQLRKPPRDVDAWVVAAAGSWVVGVDNISAVQDWWSDALCRAVTGDGDVKRTLYSDSELTVFAFRRVVLVNGIDLGAVRDDLAERLLTVELQRITTRRYDAEVMQAWQQAHPRVLGVVLDLAAQVLGRLPTTTLTDPPRMADYARVLAAVDAIQGTNGLNTYTSLAGDLAANSVASDPVLSAITAAITRTWTGTAAELLADLADHVEHGGRDWPKNARALTAILRRRAPSLRRVGWVVDDLGRRGKASAVQFCIEPPGKRQASDSTPEASDSSDRQATGTDVACLPNGGLTREDDESASEASDASVNPDLSLLGHSEKTEERPSAPPEGGRLRESPIRSLASLALPVLTDVGCTECGGRLTRAELAEGHTTHPACHVIHCAMCNRQLTTVTSKQRGHCRPCWRTLAVETTAARVSA